MLPLSEQIPFWNCLKKCTNCELSLDDLREPFPGCGRSRARQEKLHCSCTYCSLGQAEPSSAGSSFTPQSPAGLTGPTHRQREACVQAAAQPIFCREYFLKVKQRRSSKNEQLCHYLLCWDLSRDHFKDPYCLQQLMSAASAEAVLSLKVLTYLQFSVLSLVLICHFKMNAPFVKANYLHEHCTSSKSLICLTFLLAAILYFALHSTCKKERFCSKIFLCCDKARTGGGKLSYLPDGSLNFTTWNALSHCSALAWFLVLEWFVKICTKSDWATNKMLVKKLLAHAEEWKCKNFGRTPSPLLPTNGGTLRDWKAVSHLIFTWIEGMQATLQLSNLIKMKKNTTQTCKKKDTVITRRYYPGLHYVHWVTDLS